MKYQGKITDPKDLVTKEYVDNKSACIVEASLVTTAAAIYNGFSGALDNSGNPTRPIIIRRDNGITTTVDLALATVIGGMDGQTSYLLYTFTGVEEKTTYYLGIKKKGSTITFSPEYTRKNLQEWITASGVLQGDGTGGVTARAVDTTPTENSTALITSGGVKSALTSLESDLAPIHATGTTNATGATITTGTYFYLDGTLVRAIADIANGATFTLDTNYWEIVSGGLNQFMRNASSIVPQVDSNNNPRCTINASYSEVFGDLCFIHVNFTSLVAGTNLSMLQLPSRPSTVVGDYTKFTSMLVYKYTNSNDTTPVPVMIRNHGYVQFPSVENGANYMMSGWYKYRWW